MITPTLNINGSSADDLTDPRIAAYDALREVIKTLGQVVPNARDYPGDADRWRADRETHFARMRTPHTIASDIMIEAAAIKNNSCNA